MNPHLFVKVFHNRVYAYSSGSKFLEVSGKLAEWIESHQKTLDAYDSAEEEVLYCHILKRGNVLTHPLTQTRTKPPLIQSEQ